MNQQDLNKMLIGAGVRMVNIPQNLAEQMKNYGITELVDVKRFLANCLNETGAFTRFEENAYYTSSDRLKVVFPKAFSSKYNPNLYVKNPEKLLNLVYDDRIFPKGLGNINDGDGWKYRGRGAVQTTGRYNYKLLTLHTGINFLLNPDLLSGEYRFISALYFWKSNNLSKKSSLLETRQIIAGNKSSNPFGYTTVLNYYNKLKP